MDHPEYHDKLEYCVVFTVWTPTLVEEAEHRLKPYGISSDEIQQLAEALKAITRKALIRLDDDISPIDTLIQRRSLLQQSSMSRLNKLLALLYDCKNYGPLPVAHAARAGFVASTLLKSFVKYHFLKTVSKWHL